MQCAVSLTTGKATEVEFREWEHRSTAGWQVGRENLHLSAPAVHQCPDP